MSKDSKRSEEVNNRWIYEIGISTLSSKLQQTSRCFKRHFGMERIQIRSENLKLYSVLLLGSDVQTPCTIAPFYSLITYCQSILQIGVFEAENRITFSTNLVHLEVARLMCDLKNQFDSKIWKMQSALNAWRWRCVSTEASILNFSLKDFLVLKKFENLEIKIFRKISERSPNSLLDVLKENKVFKDSISQGNQGDTKI